MPDVWLKRNDQEIHMKDFPFGHPNRQSTLQFVCKFILIDLPTGIFSNIVMCWIRMEFSEGERVIGFARQLMSCPWEIFKISPGAPFTSDHSTIVNFTHPNKQLGTELVERFIKYSIFASRLFN